jgi:hypothetical protein
VRVWLLPLPSSSSSNPDEPLEYSLESAVAGEGAKRCDWRALEIAGHLWLTRRNQNTQVVRRLLALKACVPQEEAGVPHSCPPST